MHCSDLNLYSKGQHIVFAEDQEEAAKTLYYFLKGDPIYGEISRFQDKETGMYVVTQYVRLISDVAQGYSYFIPRLDASDIYKKENELGT